MLGHRDLDRFALLGLLLLRAFGLVHRVPSWWGYLVASPHPLEGYTLKMNRAEEHLQAIDQIVHRFGESDFYESFGDKDYKGRLVARVRNVQPPPPELSIRIGECAYNFRSALDQLAYALAEAHTEPLTAKLASSSAFPIYPTGPRFGGHGARPARDKIEGMSRGARAAIERLQPFHRRKNPRLASLWRLEELSNIDKHRKIHVTSAVGVRSRFTVAGTGLKSLTGIMPVFCTLQEKAIVGRFWGEFDFEQDVDVETEIVPELVFDWASEAKALRGRSVVLTLREIGDCIVFDVLASLDAELERAFPGTNMEIVVTGANKPYERLPDALWSARQAAHMANSPSGGKAFRAALLDPPPVYRR